MNDLKKRSSYLSSLVTGLVGWIGFLIVGALAFGIQIPIYTLLTSGAVIAIIQVLLLRGLFKTLRMHKHILIGAFWGLVTCIPLYFALAYLLPEFAGNTKQWLFIFAYIGAPVGAFLSYFHIDDLKVEQSFKENETIEYGRDAHWLEPFLYGVFAYLIAFLPFAHLDLTISVIIVGAMSGVFAAGISHFSPDKFKFSRVLFLSIVIVMGVLQGFLTGLLFRNHDALLLMNPLLHGIIGGVLTYFVTLLRGRQLAKKEMEAAV